MSFKSFLNAYVECLLWSETDELTEDGGEPLDTNYTADDIAPEAMKEIEQDCKDFYAANSGLWGIIIDDAQAGHDFLLTRNGHGVGFWDRGLGELGETLTEACRPYGTIGAYVGDDGKIYVYRSGVAKLLKVSHKLYDSSKVF